MSNQHRSQPNPLRIEIVDPMEISIPAKFYRFMATTFLRPDIQSFKKTCFLATSCQRKSGITSALNEIQSSFYAHFKANKMPFPIDLLHQYIQHSYVFKVFRFDL
jgi:hypothetical protein